MLMRLSFNAERVEPRATLVRLSPRRRASAIPPLADDGRRLTTRLDDAAANAGRTIDKRRFTASLPTHELDFSAFRRFYVRFRLPRLEIDDDEDDIIHALT